jgi:NAD+ kinase
MPGPNVSGEFTKPVRTAGLMSKPRSEEAARVVPELLAWLKNRGVKELLDPESAAYAGRGDGISREAVAAASDLLIVLGGDGTLLSTARASIGRDIPLLAVNLGGLGFLTSIKVDQLYVQLERALQGSYNIGRRRMLHAELWRAGQSIAAWEALNDTVLTKTEIARMIDLDVHVDDHLVCVYRADGLIISTPTGSTAYSLSAGGPIMFPAVAAFAITPICPHMLTNRPVIVPDESVIHVVPGDGPSTYLTIDGQVGEMLQHGDRVVCRRSQHFLNLILPPDMLFFDVLREKLKWGGR